MPPPPPPTSSSLAPASVRAFIRAHIAPFDDDFSPSLAPPTSATLALLARARELFDSERARGGVLSIDATTPSHATSHGPGYITGDAASDGVIVGLQTPVPLQRTMKPLGGMRVIEKACAERGVAVDERVKAFFDDWVVTHNDAVFALYTEEMKAARRAHLLLGLPDAYGRGRLIGDYRRVALYGVDALIADKSRDKDAMPVDTEDDMRCAFEVTQQIRALRDLKRMAEAYGFDISAPATSAREAIQWTYFGYLCCLKSNDGAAISFGRVDAFFDIYIQRDITAGVITESQAQELIDNFVLKLRMARQLRPMAYEDIFAGDPQWSTTVVGGVAFDDNGRRDRDRRRHMVTKTSWRFLHTLRNLGAAPEPNLTVLWSDALPKPFKRFCADVSIGSSSIQYENDDLMRDALQSDDYGISCCVSAMRLGVDMQYFGARYNMPKLLLMALNNGKDEITGAQVGPALCERDAPDDGEILRFDDVMTAFKRYMDWLCNLYVRTMNIIHACHDLRCYEAIFFALMDTKCSRSMAFGIAGLSVVADSLSAIKHARVRVVRDATTGLTKDFIIEGDFPKFGNDDDAVDAIAVQLVDYTIRALRKTPAHRDAAHTLSILTITSNVMYGKATGATPDGRPAGAPFAPGANPMHGRDANGALCSLNSVAKLPYPSCADGISNTFSIAAPSLGKSRETQIANLVAMLDGYFARGAQHLNVNCLTRDVLVDAMNHPEKYPTLTIRVSGYAVNFIRLSKEHQEEVISRTFHASL